MFYYFKKSSIQKGNGGTQQQINRGTTSKVELRRQWPKAKGRKKHPPKYKSQA
jgi:hypothetical protein